MPVFKVGDILRAPSKKTFMILQVIPERDVVIALHSSGLIVKMCRSGWPPSSNDKAYWFKEWYFVS